MGIAFAKAHTHTHTCGPPVKGSNTVPLQLSVDASYMLATHARAHMLRPPQHATDTHASRACYTHTLVPARNAHNAGPQCAQEISMKCTADLQALQHSCGVCHVPVRHTCQR